MTLTEAGQLDAAADAVSQQPPQSHWYEFDGLIPYCDAVAVVGAILVVTGVAMVYMPAAFVVAGLPPLCKPSASR